MSERRRNAATATVGLTGVGGAAALRHEALVRSHNERRPDPWKATGQEPHHTIPRKRIFAERRLISHKPGRKIWLAGAALGAVSIPAAATGVSGLLRPTGKTVAAKRDKNERTFVGEGLHGARDAVRGRTRTAVEGAPGRLVAGNYLAGAGVGSLAGGLTHHALRNKKIGGHSKAALAAATAATVGTAALPLQSKLTSRASHGAYEVTPVGVRRTKKGNRRPSSKATILDSKAMGPQAFRAQTVSKREDIGAGMSRGERRARIAASGPPIPIVGDVIQARQAARLAPEKYSRRTGAQVVGAGQVGGLAGNALGAGAALALAHKSPKFDTKARAANDWVDDKKARSKAKVYSLANRKPSETSPMVQRAIAHRRTPQLVRTGIRRTVDSPLGRAVARNPKVAAIGALAGGAIGGPAATQGMLTHTMSRDDRYRKTMAKRAADKATPIPLTQRESHTLRRRKELGAAASMLTGTTGIAALGTTLGAASLKRGKLSHYAWAKPARKRLKKATLPLVAVGGGVGGLNSFNYANIQRQEAHQIRKAAGHLPIKRQLVMMSGNWSTATTPAALNHPRRRLMVQRLEHMKRRNTKAIPEHRATRLDDEAYYEYMPGRRVSKALIRPPRIPGVRRVPGMRRGFIRQTRVPSGLIRTSSVRGGLA